MRRRQRMPDLTPPEPATLARARLARARLARAWAARAWAARKAMVGAFFTSYDWCAQHDNVPELATTISKREEQIVTAVLTDVTNAAATESLNRLAKLEARQAHGFRNPASQHRRARIAATRGTRRRSPTATRPPRQSVTKRQPVPG